MHRIKPRVAESDIFSAVARMRSAAEVKKLFGELFTPAELSDLALRWRLMRMLLGGVTQRKIARDLGVSLCKITRGARVLRDLDSMCKRLLEDNDTSSSVTSTV